MTGGAVRSGGEAAGRYEQADGAHRPVESGPGDGPRLRCTVCEHSLDMAGICGKLEMPFAHRAKQLHEGL